MSGPEAARAPEAGRQAATVFIVDDHELVRRGLRDLLEGEGFIVVGESASAEDASRRIPALAPDVSILDARLPDGTGIEVCRNVRSADSSLQCLILTSYDDDQAVRGAVLAGAAGYILKEVLSTDLIVKIRHAASGKSLFDPAVRADIIAGLGRAGQEDARLDSLTAQEKKVLQYIGEGLTNKEIGQTMFLAEKTVKNYVSSMLAKLGFQRRTQAAVFIATGRNSAQP